MKKVKTMVTQWRDHAVCRGFDPEIWFPVGTTGPAVEQTEYAKSICALCPVRQECLTDALQARASDGIFGGQTSEERKELLQRMVRV